MGLKLIAGPVIEPITLDQVKAHCRIDSSDEDVLIASMIKAARRLAESRLNRALINQAWELTLDEFPPAEVKLGMGSVLSIVSVRYLDPNGNVQTMDPEGYVLDAVNPPDWLFPTSTWPDTYNGANAVKIRFTAGYGADASDVPEEIIAWMLLQIGALYRNREAFAAGQSVAELPGRFCDALLDAERVYL